MRQEVSSRGPFGATGWKGMMALEGRGDVTAGSGVSRTKPITFLAAGEKEATACGARVF